MASFILSAFADEASNTLEGQIAALKRNHIRLLEPRNIKGSLLDKEESELFAIHNQLEAEGIGISSYGSPIGKYDIEKDFDSYRDVVRKALRVCQILGTNRMRMFSFFCKQEDLEKNREEVLYRMQEMLKMADEFGVRMCHENESLIYGCKPEQVQDLLENLPLLRGVFDPANYIQNQCQPQVGLEATFKRFEYAHIKDAQFETGAVVPPGKGDADLKKILSTIDAYTQDTVILTIEPHLHEFLAYRSIDSHKMKNVFEFANSDEAFDTAVSALKEILQELGYREGEDGIWKK